MLMLMPSALAIFKSWSGFGLRIPYSYFFNFFAVARSVLLVGRIEGEPNTRAVVQIKNNLAVFGHPKAFMLSETGFHWLGDYEITADELLGGVIPKANKKEQAKQLIYELAEMNSVVKSEDIVNLAGEKGILYGRLSEYENLHHFRICNVMMSA